ncbi:hypothetical protein ACQF36_29765 [Streptomyces sp. Marseille-Q5077]|uniref:hypothetical protein n=1 Tax=Streptomyces sp. Marseille-Q5077 TaxID=3418995 RepID=UPI003CFE39F1
MNDVPLTLVDSGENADPSSSSNWFKVIPPKHVRERWARKIKALHRPIGSLALPAIATTATLHFTNTIEAGDSLMAFGLTSLIVGYDTTIAVCRTKRVNPADAPASKNRTTTDTLARRTA